MMAIDYFIGWSQEDLEAELRAAQEDLAAGKSTTQAGAGDASVQNRVEKSIEERIKLLYRALNKKDAIKYPIAQITAITQTKAALS